MWLWLHFDPASLALLKKAGVQEQGMYCGQDDSAYTDAVMEVSSGYVYVLRLMRVIWQEGKDFLHTFLLPCCAVVLMPWTVKLRVLPSMVSQSFICMSCSQSDAHRDSYISSIESSDIFYNCHWLAWVYFYNQSSCVWVRAAHLLLYSNNLVHYTTCLHVCISGKFLEWSHLHHSEASISLPACLVDGKSITAAFTDQTLLEYASDFIPSPL